ncbi:MAG: ATP-binding protein [Thiotrichales bacterium]|nr:ATP-binding protein [Thiotrichales bacterium]
MQNANWKALQYFNLYRLLAALLFVALIWTGSLPEPLGVYHQKIFSITAHFYFTFALLITYLISSRILGLNIQVTIYVLIDVIAISLMMYASDGLSSGFGMLLVIAVAGGSILVVGRIAILYAAIASLSVLGFEIYQQLFREYFVPNYTHAGFLGVTFFVTAILGHLLASRAQKSEALAEQRAVDLAYMARLNERIVQRMQSGIIVLDKNRVIRLINNSAIFMLAASNDVIGKKIHDVSSEISDAIKEWEENDARTTFEILQSSSNLELKVAITDMGKREEGSLLLFMDEIAQLRQQAQGLKLASLGRLTASIAHEIRNPLGAISHAGQLLGESDNISKEDQRLMQIISDQSHRINSIIENVLSISKRKNPDPSGLMLKNWLEKFVNEICDKYQISRESIIVEVEPGDLQIKMDSIQLHQVLWNLSENAIRYSRGEFILKYHCALHPDSGRSYIDVIDTGPGLPEQISNHLFEPFVTTESSGTGLGLYIARELCEANQATLFVHLNSDEGCHFRINFPHFEKKAIAS